MKALNYQDCNDCLTAVMKRASSDGGWPIAMTITDAAGYPIVFARMDGVAALGVQATINKAFTVTFTGRDAEEFHGLLTEHHLDISWFGHPQLTPMLGALRITDGNQCIGAIAVSGRPADQDQELCKYALSVIKQKLGI